MKPGSFLFAGIAPLLVAAVVAACTADQNLGSHGSPGACAQATACCAALSAAVMAACQTQVSAAEAQADSEAACGVLLQGYASEGLCQAPSSSNGDGGAGGEVLPEASNGTDGPVTASNDGVTLTVTSSQQISNVGGANVVSGQIYVAVALELTNGSPAVLPLAFSLFSADTTTGIEYTASAETAVYSGGCDPTTSLTSGHSVSCAVIFQTPVAAVTSSLSYALPNGAHVTVPLVTTTCSICSGLCVDLATDPANCGSCGNVIDKNGTCENGVLVCPSGETACGATCTATETDPQNCGKCGTTCGIPVVLPGTCIAGACTVCNNGETTCASTTSMETCTANGQWGPATACSGDYVCTASACAPPCATGSALCSGSCVDIESNNADCGGCGLACPSGCAGGECTVTLGAFSPVAMAVDANNLYFTTDTADTPPNFTVVQTPIDGDGGAAITLASGTAAAGSIAVSGSNVYWLQWTTATGDAGSATAGGAVMKVPVGGTTATPVVSFPNYPSGLAVDTTSIYWATAGTSANEYADGTIMKASLAGTSLTTIASMQSDPAGIAIDGTNIYWATQSYGTINGGTLMKAPLSGSGTPTTIASGQSPTAIAIDANNIYWIDFIGTGAGTIKSVPLGGGTPVSLTEIEYPRALATDGLNIYFSADDQVGNGTDEPLFKMPITGAGSPATLVPYTQFYADSIVIDATSVYFGGEGLSTGITRITPK